VERKTVSASRVCQHDAIAPWMCSATERPLMIVKPRLFSVVRRKIYQTEVVVMYCSSIRLLFLSA